MGGSIRNNPSRFKSFRYKRRFYNMTRREAESIARAIAKLNEAWFGYNLKLLALYDAYNNELVREIENILGRHVLIQEVGDGWFAVYEVDRNGRRE